MLTAFLSVCNNIISNEYLKNIHNCEKILSLFFGFVNNRTNLVSMYS